jgi:hypothetical protein
MHENGLQPHSLFGWAEIRLILLVFFRENIAE